MGHQDAEIAEIVVVLAERIGMTFQEAVVKLTGLGLDVSDTDQGDGVVEGTIDESKIAAIRGLPFVKYVRKVFEYEADFPTGDPRDLDKTDDDADAESADDAGA